MFLATLLTTKSANNGNKNKSQQSLSIRLDNEPDEIETKEEEKPTATVATTVNSSDNKKVSSNDESITNYSNFLYWRDTLPELKLDEQDISNDIVLKHNELEIEIDTHVAQDDAQDFYKLEKQQRRKSNPSSLIYCDFNGVTESLLSSSNSTINYQNSQLTYSFGNNYNQNDENSIENMFDNELNEQDIVPPRLLSYFITMVDMNAQTSLDSDMNYNCAFNFPAIANTLGPSYWKYIRDLYKRLAEDVNWKVRQTLAYSIHELAQILGAEVTQIDLVPIFDSYIKDVDEVRIGIVSNLSKFLKVLKIEYRLAYMPKLNDFLKMDNQRNWRFRNELGL